MKTQTADLSIEALKTRLPELQSLIDRLRETSYKAYVEDHQLRLIDGKYLVLDRLLQMRLLH